MAHIPMKGDPPTLQQAIKKYGDPIDAMASMHFDCLLRSKQHEAAGESQEAIECLKLAETCQKDMAQYGYVPRMVDGEAKAVRK